MVDNILLSQNDMNDQYAAMFSMYHFFHAMKVLQISEHQSSSNT